MATNAIFDAFNARFLLPQQVGSTFVKSPFLIDTIKPTHTAVLGPRGSGKTTLLKMLTLPALIQWKDPLRDELAESLQFLSVYIPANLTWSAEYRAFSRRIIISDVEEMLSIALFRHSVLVSLLETWRDASKPEVAENGSVSRFYLPIEADQEGGLVRDLADSWGIENAHSTVDGLRRAITQRIQILQRVVVEAAFGDTAAGKLLRKYPFLGSHFFDDTAAFIDFINRNYGRSVKIALCFDELEIVPDSIARAILRSPRSIDSRIIIKYSAAPYIIAAPREQDAGIPMERNDFTLVFLSSFASREIRDFSRALFLSLCGRHGVDADPDEILGQSLIEGGNRSKDRRYASRGTTQKKFEALFSRDQSFEAYAQRKGLNIDDLSGGSENRRAADIRKIIWPVLLREEFLFVQESVREGDKPRRRIKTAHPISDLYTGSGSLISICEGNPRWIIGLLDPMAASYSRSGVAVQRSQQKRAIERMVTAFFALISTVPTGAQSLGIESMIDLVSTVAGYFQKSVLGVEFNADPVLSFYVDGGISPPVRELIGRGVNIGVFVTTHDGSGDQPYRVGDLSGLKVRLSNLLAPYYRLPLAGGRTINLSTILDRSKGTKKESALRDLFGDQ